MLHVRDLQRRYVPKFEVYLEFESTIVIDYTIGYEVLLVKPSSRNNATGPTIYLEGRKSTANSHDLELSSLALYSTDKYSRGTSRDGMSNSIWHGNPNV